MSSIQSFYFVGVITLVSSAHVYGQKKDKMNVLFIIADDMRQDKEEGYMLPFPMYTDYSYQ